MSLDQRGALAQHVPELVLLFGTFVMTGALVGYASDVGGAPRWCRAAGVSRASLRCRTD